jgi:hypothetical protein
MVNKRAVIVLLIGLLLPLACGVVSQQYQLNNEVRLAIYEYERKAHGPVDDLIIHFNRDEPRIHFEGQNQNGGRTVWLPSLDAEGYFDVQPPERTYLYIREIEYNEDRSAAAVKVYQGDGKGYQGWQLTLVKDKDNRWEVKDEIEITGNKTTTLFMGRPAINTKIATRKTHTPGRG